MATEQQARLESLKSELAEAKQAIEDRNKRLDQFLERVLALADGRRTLKENVKDDKDEDTSN